MQEFCLKLCQINNIDKPSDEVRTIKLDDPRSFFSEIAINISKIAFNKLARGSKQRDKLLVRNFTDGTQGDLYLGILKGISLIGPKLKINYQEIKDKLAEITVNARITAGQIKKILNNMDRIAKNEIKGEPIIEWDKEDEVLYIVDPYFAFYLRWGLG